MQNTSKQMAFKFVKLIIITLICIICPYEWDNNATIYSNGDTQIDSQNEGILISIFLTRNIIYCNGNRTE